MSLRPAQPRLTDEPDALRPWLQAFIQDSMPEWDGTVHEADIRANAGPCAFTLGRSKRWGLVGLWVIPAEVFVFATYIMGSLENVKKELDDAMTIVTSATFEDGDDGGRH